MDTKEIIKKQRRAALTLACDKVGGEAKLAEAIGKTRSHISTWKYRGFIPAEMALPLEAASGVSRHVLRPDLYPVSEEAVA